MTVLVAGASGTTGAELLRQLGAAGVRIRAMSRSAAKVTSLRAPGIEAVHARFDDPRALAVALKGVDAAYVATTAAPTMSATEGALGRAAAKAGVHLVKLSAFGAGPDAPLRFARVHAESEAAIDAANGSWTSVRPNGFMQNDLSWAPQLATGIVATPAIDAAWSAVDVRDVIAVVMAALLDADAYAGRRLTVTGPEPRTPRDRIGALAGLLDRRLTAVDVPLDAMERQLRGAGFDAWTVGGVVELFKSYADGRAAAVTPDGEAVLARPLRRWETFVGDHLAAYAGGSST